MQLLFPGLSLMLQNEEKVTEGRFLHLHKAEINVIRQDYISVNFTSRIRLIFRPAAQYVTTLLLMTH